jgi:hypothetical protein
MEKLAEDMGGDRRCRHGLAVGFEGSGCGLFLADAPFVPWH